MALSYLARSSKSLLVGAAYTQYVIRPAAASVMRSMATAATSQSASANNLSVDVKGQVAIVRLDAANSKVNTLNRALMTEFASALDQITANPNIKAAVLISNKPDGFIAGADISMLSAAQSEQELKELSRQGQELMDRVANSPVPFIAAIHGQCLGGGLEVALACKYRVVSSSPKTQLGLPEVLLGLLPGAGGTQRLPRLIGAQKALDLMLTGKNVRPEQARSYKLIDVVADPNALEQAALTVANEVIAGKFKGNRRARSWIDWALEDITYGRDFLFKQAKKQVLKQTNGKYPAPLAILDVVREGMERGMAFGLLKEADAFGKLGMSPESKSLVTLFFGQTALKKNRFGKPARNYETIGVIGAGLMGAGVAQVSVEKGFKVVLKDRDAKGLARGEQQIFNNLNQKVKKRSMTVFDRDTTMSRVIGVTDADPFAEKHIAKADMIIEAVFEDLNLKQKVLTNLEKLVPEHCVIASNTSALPIKDIAKALARPQNVVGMHYFSPVDKMPLLEVITTDQTSKEAAAAAVEVGIKQGKTVIVVKDGPGFYTTRILSPFMVEAGGLLQEGVEIKELDSALKNFGFPVGPVTLFDEVGIDVGNHIQPTLMKAFGARMGGANTQLMEEMAKAGFYGRKSSKGFFLYEGKTKEINPDALALIEKYKVAPKGDLSVEEIQNRVVLRMVNEAVFCLQDGTLETPLDGDMGAVFGLGFPPFYGGPFRYIDSRGPNKIVDTLNRLRDIHGERFTPAPLLVDIAKGNKKFHSK